MRGNLKCSLKVVLIFAVLGSFAITDSIFAQYKADKIDEFMTLCYNSGQFNGTVLVAENGEVIYKKAFGFADLKTKESLKIDYAFYLGSVSKQFTAMAIMMLAERQKLNYDEALVKYFPEFPSWAKHVTIRHLMTHTSGIPDYFELITAEPDMTNHDVLNALVVVDSLHFDPGDQYEYSNSNYALLAMIVEKASGQPFHIFLKKNIFAPLEMSSSLVYDESKPKIKRRAIGYTPFGEKDDYNLLTVGAGGIFSTVNDLFKWDQALYTEKLVSQSTLNEAFTPHKLNNDSTSNYGFGWAIRGDEGDKWVEHFGALAGFRTYIGRQLKDKNTVILLTNTGNTYLEDIRGALINILYDEPYELPKVSIAITIHRTLKEKGINTAIEQYYELKAKYPDKYDFRESELNALGYQLLRTNKIKEAIEIFKLNVEAYPDVYNTYDSLAEAYMLNGDKELAIKNYAKSLVLNPKNTNAIEMLEKISEK